MIWVLAAGFLGDSGDGKPRDKANYRAAYGSAGAGVGSRLGSYNGGYRTSLMSPRGVRRQHQVGIQGNRGTAVSRHSSRANSQGRRAWQLGFAGPGPVSSSAEVGGWSWCSPSARIVHGTPRRSVSKLLRIIDADGQDGLGIAMRQIFRHFWDNSWERLSFAPVGPSPTGITRGAKWKARLTSLASS